MSLKERFVVGVEGIDTHFEFLQWFADRREAEALFAECKVERKEDEEKRNVYLLRVLRTTEKERG